MFKDYSVFLSRMRNRFLLTYEYLKRRDTLRAFPNELILELTNVCNLRCIICPRQKMKREQGYMEFLLFKKIVDEAKDFIELIDLDLYGESLTHPRIFDMIRYCRSQGLLTLLNTNMSYVDSKLSAGLIDSGLDMLIVSLDGISAETYESIRVGARFKETIGNIESFLTLKQKGKRPFVTVQMIYINKTQKEAGVFINLWKNKVDSVRIRPYENVDRDKDYLYAVPLKPQSDYRPCIQLWRGLVVYWDGTVVPCCFDYDKFEVLGNLERDSLRQIWNSEKMIYLRQKHIMGHRLDIPLCKECHPFEPSTLLTVGGIFLNPLTSRKVLHHLERILIFKGIELFKY